MSTQIPTVSDNPQQKSSRKPPIPSKKLDQIILILGLIILVFIIYFLF